MVTLLWSTLLACAESAPITVVTFNTGLGAASGEVGERVDTWYGNGLSWPPAMDVAEDSLSRANPDLVAFQEVFDPEECADIPVEEHEGFVCADWKPGDEHVALQVLGEGWELACHPGNTDKCVAVHERLGPIEAVDGFPVEGCGSGARVARVTVLTDEGRLTVVSVHGSSGFDTETEGCRVAQVEQVFVDLGDGEPGANGRRNLILGDFNTDPGRLAGSSDSATRWNDFVQAPWAFHTGVDTGLEPSYAGLMDIDHVVSDTFEGDCTHGFLIGEGFDAFDHLPIVCSLTEADP